MATRVGATPDTGTPLPQITAPQKIAPEATRTLTQLFLQRLTGSLPGRHKRQRYGRLLAVGRPAADVPNAATCHCLPT
ncbi:hypothetical protein [Streptomyces sp. NPDC127190]|uniref:hypothetical protein n=1 Tax=unclassified Streptomyces TaxID=2593676 RepID=UPI003633CA72